jgi:hypothetical protein
MFHLQVNGKRIEALSQDTEGLSEPIDTTVTTWDDLAEAMGWALHQSWEQGCVPVDVVAECGTPQARVSAAPAGRKIEHKPI